ncbi:MAG: hypothetical protein ABI618_17490, partial [Nitrospirota bacterium]
FGNLFVKLSSHMKHDGVGGQLFGTYHVNTDFQEILEDFLLKPISTQEGLPRLFPRRMGQTGQRGFNL